MRARLTAVGIAGASLCAVMLIGAIHTGVLSTVEASVHFGVAGPILITGGLVVWALHPDSRFGLLLTAVPFA